MVPGRGPGRRRRRYPALAGLISAQVVVAGAAGAADVEITSDTATVNLDTFTGTTARIWPNVTVSNGVSATTQAWDVTNDGNVAGGNSVVLGGGGAFRNSAGATVNGTLTAVTLGTLGPGGGPDLVDNYGTIVGGIGEGVTLFDGGEVINRAGASISTSTGLNAVSVGQGSSRSVINSGIISSTSTSGFSTGVLMQGGPASLTNTATGTIFGDFNGVYTSPTTPLTLDNAGSITGRRGPAIEADAGGTFVNSGTIQSDSDGILTRSNNASTVTNTGTIGSTGGGRAIAFGGNGTHTLNLGTGSILNGNVQGGTGIDNLVLMGTGSEAINKFLSFENLTMQGADWNLTGTGTFTTGTTVQSGVMRVNGQLTSPTVAIQPGGTLGGAGTVVGLVTNSGNIAPGNSIGTLNITGNYTQASGSTYTVEVNNSPASDLLNITGTATIQNGTTVSVLAAPGFYTLGQRYTILTATGGVTGNYTNLVDNAPFVDFALNYDLNNVYLDVIRSSVSFTQIAVTPNQRAAAFGMENLPQGHPAFDAVVMLDTPNALRAFDLLSGEIHASIGSTLLDDSRLIRDMVLSRLRQFGDGGSPFAQQIATLTLAGNDEAGAALAYAGKRPRAQPATASAGAASPASPNERVVAAWAQLVGNWGRVDGDGNAAALQRRTGGLFSGIDATFDQRWRFGIAGGYQRTSLDVTDRNSSGTIDTYHLTAYAGTWHGPLSAHVGTAYSWHDVSTSRSIAFPGFADTATASYHADTAQVFGEIGYSLDGGPFALQPFVGLAHVHVGRDAFGESGGAARLTGASSRFESTFSTVGVRAAAPIPLTGMTHVVAKMTLAWRHAFNDTVPTTQLAFSSAPTAPFTVAGVAIARDAAVIELGLDGQIGKDTLVGVAYAGQLAGNTQDHSIRGSLVRRF